MKNKTLTLLTVLGCALSATFTNTAQANHRAGDFELPEIMTAGDFNGDGNLDLAVNLSGFDNFAVLTGNAQGVFTLKRHVDEDTLPKSIVSGDVNGDGKLDIVSISQWGYDIKVYLGDGTGNFQVANVLNGDGEPNRLRLVDLNKDGILDIVANAPTEGKILIYYGLGGGAFTTSAVELEGYMNDFGLKTGDFNGDGNVDIAVAYYTDTSSTGSHLQILLGDGAGNFTTGQNITINPQCNNIVVYDLNKDGNPDLILAGAGSENVAGIFIATYLGDGTGNFTQKQVIDLGIGSIKGEISIGDFNEDGNIDVAFPLATVSGEQRPTAGMPRSSQPHDSSAPSPLASLPPSTSVLIFLGDGTGNFVQGQSATVGQEPGSTWAADFNKDGHVDLACSNRTDGTLSILLGNGDGTFTTSQTIQLNSLATP